MRARCLTVNSHLGNQPSPQWRQVNQMDTATLAYWPADTSVALLEQTVGDALRAAAAEAPGHIAIVEGTPGPMPRRKLTYTELLAAAEQVARALLTRFRPGEHVAVWSGNSREWMLLEYGAGLASRHQEV